uniref:Uncharacterized protein n=1 Tax=Trichogramma kaykai TaxID=54128 RepID=A0ABD2VSM9_9HYME
MSYSELFENVTLKKYYETDRKLIAASKIDNNRQEIQKLKNEKKQLLKELAPKTIIEKQLAQDDSDISIIEHTNKDKIKFSLKPATLKLYTSTPEVKNKVVSRVETFLKTIPEQVEKIKRENQVDEDIINKSVTDAIFEEEETVKNKNIVDKLFNPFKEYFYGHEKEKPEENANLPNSHLVPKQEIRDPEEGENREHSENSEHRENSDISEDEQENEIEMAAAVESALFKRLLKESSYGETRSATQLIKDLDSIHQKDGEKKKRDEVRALDNLLVYFAGVLLMIPRIVLK